MNYLLSYPHSGNTLVRYLVELVTLQPTVGYHKISVNELFGLSKDKCFTNYDNIILTKRHSLLDIVLKEEDRVIFILRNPQDHRQREGKGFKSLAYCNNIVQFSKLTKDRGLLIYYENILMDAFWEILDILDFIEATEESYKRLNNIRSSLEYKMNRLQYKYNEYRKNKPG